MILGYHFHLEPSRDLFIIVGSIEKRITVTEIISTCFKNVSLLKISRKGPCLNEYSVSISVANFGKKILSKKKRNSEKWKNCSIFEIE